ncbi:Tetraspanin-1 [Cricetulus griseus]|nr:Tetraspanin-1 [Cricetulus griseus]
MMFFVILLIIFIAEIAAAVVALVYTTMAEQFLTLLVVPAIRDDYGNQTEFTNVWNSTMEGLKCCGFNGYTDFNNSSYLKETSFFPPYCCFNSTSGILEKPCNEEKAKQLEVQGCFKQLLHSIRTNAVTAGGVAVGIAALELAAMIVSMYLYCNLE